MSDSPSENPPPDPQSPARPRPLVWLLGAIVGTALAAVLAAHLPDRAKLLGLFPLIWGVAAGAGLSAWANECHLHSRRGVLAVSWLLLAAGEAGLVLEAWRMHRNDMQRQFSKDPSAGFMREAQKSAQISKKPEEAALQQQFLAELDRVRQVRKQALALPTFLQRRLKMPGYLPQPWPEVYWAGEILLGSLCGIWIMRRQGLAPLPPPAASDPAV